MNSLNVGEARHMAQIYLDGHKGVDDLVINDKLTKDYESGWLFVPSYRLFVEKNDQNWSRIGGFDIFITRNGAVVELPVYVIITNQVEEYVRERDTGK